MATVEKQEQKDTPVKDEMQDSEFEQKPSARGPPQDEDDDYSDDYSDDYDDDDYEYSDEGDDYYDDEDEDDEDQGKAVQAYKPNGQSISSRDQGGQNVRQKINNGNISRAPDSKKTIDDQDGLKLKLDVNLDIEVELKARIHGDLTLALLA